MTNKFIKGVTSLDKYVLTKQDNIIIHSHNNYYAKIFEPYVNSVNNYKNVNQETIHILIYECYEELQATLNITQKEEFKRILIINPDEDITKCFIFKIGNDICLIKKTLEPKHFEAHKNLIINELKVMFVNTFIGYDFHILDQVVSIMKYYDYENFINNITELYDKKYYIGILKLITARYYNGMIYRATTLLNFIIKKWFNIKINKVEQTWGKIDNIDDSSLCYLKNFIVFLEMLKDSHFGREYIKDQLDYAISKYPETLARTYFNDKLRCCDDQETQKHNENEEPDFIY